jgi:alcohol dehydrogenase
VYDKILPNPVKKHVMEGAALAMQEGCDFIIGLGGGSSIDSAKAIAIMAKNPGDFWDYIYGGSGKGKPFGEVLPIVAITTTAGTGTEADPWMVVTKEETMEKIGLGNAQTFPVLSIVDPELMVTVPPKLTAYQGFDALFHSTEGYIASVANHVSDIYALKSIELVFKYLSTAVNHGDNIEARSHVALANTLSGMVESTSSCTSEHSMEHALSAYKSQLPHGAGLIMLSVAYYNFFEGKAPERFAEMARVAGAKDWQDPGAFVRALIDLQKSCGVDDLKMSDYGIHFEDMEELAKKARHTMGGLFEVDRYKLSLEETVEIISKSFK